MELSLEFQSRNPNQEKRPKAKETVIKRRRKE